MSDLLPLLSVNATFDGTVEFAGNPAKHGKNTSTHSAQTRGVKESTTNSSCAPAQPKVVEKDQDP